MLSNIMHFHSGQKYQLSVCERDSERAVDFSHPHPNSCYRLIFILSAWRIHQSSPTGCLQLCSVLTLWPVSPPSPACCLQEKMGRPSSPARRQTSPACIPSSPAQVTAEHHPPTDTARVSAPTLTNSSSYPPSKYWAHLILSCFLKSVRCSARRVSSATSSCWMGQPATPWVHLTPPQPPPGAAALSPRPHCTHTPQPPSTLPASPPPSPPPEMDIHLRAERAERARSFRRPWRMNVWAHQGGPEPAAVFSIWPLLLEVCTRHPTPIHTCWAPTVHIWQVHRNIILLLSTRTLDPGSTPHIHPNSTIRCGYPPQVRTYWSVSFSLISIQMKTFGWTFQSYHQWKKMMGIIESFRSGDKWPCGKIFFSNKKLSSVMKYLILLR